MYRYKKNERTMRSRFFTDFSKCVILLILAILIQGEKGSPGVKGPKGEKGIPGSCDAKVRLVESSGTG